MWYVPVIIGIPEGRVVRPMRYHCRPKEKPFSYDRKFDGLFNARRDSPKKFWRDLFGTHHGLLVLNGFQENVSLHRVEGRELAPDEDDKNVVLRFKPDTGDPMLVPVLWSHWEGKDEPALESCALIADEPPEVSAAGHDRCSINLTREAAEE